MNSKWNLLPLLVGVVVIRFIVELISSLFVVSWKDEKIWLVSIVVWLWLVESFIRWVVLWVESLFISIEDESILEFVLVSTNLILNRIISMLKLISIKYISNEMSVSWSSGMIDLDLISKMGTYSVVNTEGSVWSVASIELICDVISSMDFFES
jgi:hypothetical protein